MVTLTCNLCGIGSYIEGDICPVSRLQSSLMNSRRMWEQEIPLVLPLGRIFLGNFKPNTEVWNTHFSSRYCRTDVKFHSVQVFWVLSSSMKKLPSSLPEVCFSEAYKGSVMQRTELFMKQQQHQAIMFLLMKAMVIMAIFSQSIFPISSIR